MNMRMMMDLIKMNQARGLSTLDMPKYKNAFPDAVFIEGANPRITINEKTYSISYPNGLEGIKSNNNGLEIALINGDDYDIVLKDFDNAEDVIKYISTDISK